MGRRVSLEGILSLRRSDAEPAKSTAHVGVGLDVGFGWQRPWGFAYPGLSSITAVNPLRYSLKRLKLQPASTVPVVTPLGAPVLRPVGRTWFCSHLKVAPSAAFVAIAVYTDNADFLDEHCCIRHCTYRVRSTGAYSYKAIRGTATPRPRRGH